jgi:hypothetical protein
VNVNLRLHWRKDGPSSPSRLPWHELPCSILLTLLPSTNPVQRSCTAQHSFGSMHRRIDPLMSPGPSKSNLPGDRASRSKTVFQIARPPPSKKSRTRLRRPRILLQLQQLSDHKRPLPVLDVLPSSYVAPRLAQRFPKIFKGKSSLGPHDIIVTSSNSSGGFSRAGQDTGLSSDDEACDSPEVVATICRQIRRPQEDIGLASAEICLDQGLVWKATPLPRGGYEFNARSADGSPLQARWVRRDRPYRWLSSLPDATSEAAKRFTFSILNPSARRHPVIASMTTDSIEVHDQYPAAVAQNTPQLEPTSPISILSEETSYFDIQDLISQPKEPLIHTDHHLRSLIVITGIYVSLEEGWAQDAPRSPRKMRDQELDSPSTVESRATITKVGRANNRIFHTRPATLPDVAHVEKTSPTFDRANSTRAANTGSSNRRSLSARLRHGKEDHGPVLIDDGVSNRSGCSSRPNSQGLPPYLRPRESSELARVGVKFPFEKTQFAQTEGDREEASAARSSSTKSSKTYELRRRSGRTLPTFRRFFSLPCIGPASASRLS